MSQGPWQSAAADTNTGGQGGYVAAPRLSALAVSSLVFSLVCCLPGTGAIAAALGGGALVSIGKSEGRLSGKPLAIVGLVLGLACSVLWIGLAIGVSSGWNTLRQGMNPALTAFENADTAKVKTLMMQDLQEKVGEEQVMRFSAAIKQKLGRPEGLPSNLLDVVGFYMNLGSAVPPKYLAMMQGPNPTAVFLPVPVQFANGRAMVLLQLPAGGQSRAGSGQLTGILRNVIIILSDGTEIRLLSDEEAAVKSVGGAAPPPPDEAEPAAGEEPVKKKPGF